MSGPVFVDHLADGVARLVVDNPPVNQVDGRVRAALEAALAELDDDPRVRVLVVAGRGSTFCAGNDLAEVEALSDPEAFAAAWNGLCGRLRAFAWPTVAAVQGAAMGGGLELALSCDLRVASPDARFAASALRIGVVWSVHTLVRQLGVSAARDLVLTARTVDAEEARALGIVHRVADTADSLHDEALALASRLAAQPAPALRAAKLLLADAEDAARDIHDRRHEATFATLAGTAEHQERLARVRAELRGRRSAP